MAIRRKMDEDLEMKKQNSTLEESGNALFKIGFYP